MDTWAKYEKRSREQLVAACVAMDEALVRVHELCELNMADGVNGGMANVDTLWPSDVLDAIAGRGPSWEGQPH